MAPGLAARTKGILDRITPGSPVDWGQGDDERSESGNHDRLVVAEELVGLCQLFRLFAEIPVLRGGSDHKNDGLTAQRLEGRAATSRFEPRKVGCPARHIGGDTGEGGAKKEQESQTAHGRGAHQIFMISPSLDVSWASTSATNLSVSFWICVSALLRSSSVKPPSFCIFLAVSMA